MNPRAASGVYGPMEAPHPQVSGVRIAGRRAGGESEFDGMEVLADLTETEDSPPPSAAHEPDGGEAFAAFYRADYANVARLSYTLGDVDLGREATDEAMARVCALGQDPRLRQPGRLGLSRRSQLGVLEPARVFRSLPFIEHAAATEPPVSDPAIADALRRLDVKLRSVVVCRLLLDWSVDETAGALRIKPGTVKSRLHRALASLERSLGHMRS